MVWRCFIALLACSFAATAFGQTVDAIKANTDAAQVARAEARAAARAELLKSIDDRIKAAVQASDTEVLRAITSQKDAFVTTAALPTHPSLKDSVVKYEQTVRQADAQLVAIYEAAIEQYTANQKFGEAAQLRVARRQVLEGQSPAAAPGTLPTTEAIAETLSTAKATHQQSIIAARTALLDTIDARTNAATTAGDLKMITALRSARAAAEVNGPLPAELKDAGILAAREREKLSIQSANNALIRAYEAVVRDYTRTRNIDQAMAAQAELDAFKAKLSGTAVTPSTPQRPARPLEPIYRLAKILPPQYETSDTYSVVREGGIVPKAGGRIFSKRNDFLSKDYIFDVWVQIERTGEAAVVGVGDGRPENSIGILIRPTNDQNHGAHFIHGDSWGQRIVDIREPGIYFVRVERHGVAMTFSVGVEKDGKIDFFGSRTVQDPKQVQQKLDEKSARLFFGGAATFKQVRLTMMPPSVPVAATPGTIIPLTRDLTPQLYTAKPYAAPATGGVIPNKDGYFFFRATDFLNDQNEYLLDVWVKLERRGGWSNIGIGDGKPENSIAISLRPADEEHRGVALQKGDTWGEKMGPMRDAGVYIARIEKRGTTMTFSVGTEKDGRFELDCTKTVTNPKTLQPKLNERSAHLYFGGDNQFLKYRLVTGAAARAAANAPFAGAAAGSVAVVPPAPATQPVAVTPPATLPANPNNPPAAPMTPPAASVTPPNTPVPPAVSVVPPTPPVAPPVGKAEFVAIGTLTSKAAPKLAAGDGRLTFSAPQHDRFWHGANGVVLPAGPAWQQAGTVWKCEKFQPRPWGMTFIHPLGNGHILVDIGEGGPRYRDDGQWQSKKGWTDLAVAANFNSKFPLDRDATHTVQSELLPTGEYRLTINGKVCATAKFTAAKPLNFGSDFKGAGLPPVLGKGYTGAIVQNSYRTTTIAGDLSVSPR